MNNFIGANKYVHFRAFCMLDFVRHCAISQRQKRDIQEIYAVEYKRVVHKLAGK